MPLVHITDRSGHSGEAEKIGFLVFILLHFSGDK